MNFSENHLKAFAALSHDRNPLHLDPEYCRKTLFGKVVVYGVCLLLRGLGTWAQGRRFRLKSIRAEFRRPLFTDEDYHLEITESGDEVQLQYFKGTFPQATVSFVPQPWPDREIPEQRGEFVPLEVPRDQEWGKLDGVKLAADPYPYGMNLEELGGLQKYFGLAPGQFPSEQLNALLWSSYYIGMECPGRQAVLCRFELQFAAPDPAEGAFYLNDLRLSFDPKLNRALITGKGKGILSLKLIAFRRPLRTG